jgi:AraC-like DNA-binding protein
VGESHTLWGSAPAFANVIVPVTLLAPPDQTIVEDLTTHRRVEGIATAEVEARIEGLIRESDDALHRLRYYALLYELLAELAGAVPPARREAGDGRQAAGWLEALIRKLNRAQKIPQAAELPTWCGKSPEHIARSFVARLGVSPSHYLNGLRLSRAARLLQESNLRVIDIAEEVGFANQPYFQRLFKRRYGVAPGAYRRSGKRRAPS